MDSIAIWNKIVEGVRKIEMSPEEKVQKLWEDFFSDSNLFGYSKAFEEVLGQYPVRAGTRTIRPDIVIIDFSKNKELFLVELKQYGLSFNDHYREQLFSYMLLKSIKIGLLICDKIYLYYNIFDQHNCEGQLQIQFDYDNATGGKFVELFNKKNFDEEKIKQFIEETNQSDEYIREIQASLQNSSQEQLIDIIKNYFIEKYPKKEIDSALKGLSVSINFNGVSTQTFDHGSNTKQHKKQITDTIKKRENAPPLSFSACGIPVGAVLYYLDDNSISCTVVGDGKVNYKGEIKSLSRLVEDIQKKKPVQGTKWFTYNGEILTDLRKRLEKEGKYGTDL